MIVEVNTDKEEKVILVTISALLSGLSTKLWGRNASHRSLMPLMCESRQF